MPAAASVAAPARRNAPPPAARLAAALLLALAGCLSSPATPLTNVIVYWQFQRATFVDGVGGYVSYDGNPQHPPVAQGRCPQSGVDRIEIRDGAGEVVLASTPCVTAGVQGVALLGYPEGTWTLVVRGYRDGVAEPLYVGQALVDVVAGPAIPLAVVAVGIPDGLSIRVAIGAEGPATCGAADVQRLDATLLDTAGTVVWRNPVPCAPADPLELALGPVDRDAYRSWIAAVRTSAVPSGEVVASACDVPLPHFGPQTIDVPLEPGACSPPP